MNKIKTLIRKACAKLFRKIFAEAYPDGEKFMSLWSAIDGRPNEFIFNGGLAARSYISARGINTSGTNGLTFDEAMKFIENHPEWRGNIIAYFIAPQIESK